MATIVNERDKLLQSAASRFAEVTLPSTVIVPATKALLLTSSSLLFKVPTSGPALPSSITLTATKKAISGTVSFNVTAGTATLTGSGDTRTLAYSDMSSDSVTVTASVVADSVTYISTVTVAKVKDGVNGTNGTNGIPGQRGSVDLYVIGSSWSDSTANSAILSATGSSTRYAGDKVTIYNNAGFADTRYWDGISAWVTGQIINGNILVSGTVTSDKIGTNELTSVNINTSGRIKAYGDGAFGPEIPTYRASIYGANASTSTSYIQVGVVGYSNYGSGILGFSVTDAGVKGEGVNGGSFATLTDSGDGIIAIGSQYGYAARFTAPPGHPARIRWGSVTCSPPPGGTTTFLRADGTWSTPSSSGGVTSFNSRTGAVTLNSTDIATYAAGTLSVNVTGTAGNASALGGLAPSNWIQFIGTSAASRSFAGYMQVYANGTYAWIPLYV